VRFLIDENLSPQIIQLLHNSVPGCVHVRTAPGRGSSDHAIWDYAKARGLVLVTRDEDFDRLVTLQGPPPKVIWIALGNCTTAEVVELHQRHLGDIEQFVNNAEAGILALG